MADFLNVYNLNRQKTAVLQNAFDITETQELNKIYTLDFQIPATDEKVKYILPFHFVRYGDKGELYRIIKVSYADSDTSILSVFCEHVIAVLCDELMFGAIQYGGGTIKTSNVISFLLSKQKTQNWVLAECDFDRRFEYLWEQENILNALFSIPKEFTKAYKWTYDTTVHPWRLSLKAIDATIHPEYYIRAKRNLLSSGTAQDYTGICTRIYALGYGEGVNQLSIKDATVTNIQRSGNVAINATVSPTSTTKYGNTYIQSPAAIVAQYGIKEKVLVDRRYEDANSLFSYAQTMLEGLQTPSMTRSFDVVDLYPLTSQAIDRAEVGKICRMTGDDTIAYITKTKRVLDEPGNLEIDLSTKATDIASSIADLADRVRIESVYAQGATQLYQHSKDANATTKKGMVISLYFPEEMRQINKVLLRLKLGAFRSYSQASSGESGSINQNTVDNGAIDQNTLDSGAIDQNTLDDGAIDQNTLDDGAIDQNTLDDGAIDQNTLDDGAIDTDTLGGGAIDTESGSSGGGSGTTGTASVGSTAISGNIVSQPAWSNDSNFTTTEPTPNGAVEVFGNDIKFYGGTYSQSGTDGYHSHEHKYPHGDYATIDGGYHSHDVSVDVPYTKTDVFGNDWHFTPNGKSHIHTITLNSLSHYHDINISASANFGSHSHSFSTEAHTHKIQVGEHSHKLQVAAHHHKLQVAAHHHKIQVAAHHHKLQVAAHHHKIQVAAHSHGIKVGPHSHDIKPGIFESGNPTGFSIYVGGTFKTTINSTSYDADITKWLLNKNQIPRNSWIDIEIRPNDLAYVQSSVFVQGFVQSRGGGNY